MSTNKYKWLTLGLASIVISGCSVGGGSHLNLGIADAFRKSKNCFMKKKLSYQAPAANPTFGYATPVSSSVPVEHSVVTTMPVQSTPAAPSSCGCSSCNSNSNNYSSVSIPDTEFYMPLEPTLELVDPPVVLGTENSITVSPLPLEGSQGNLELENPLPPAIDSIETLESPSIDIDPTEEEGVIEPLDSASIEISTDENLKPEEDLKVTPERDGNSILDTAATPLEAKTPTSAGNSVVEQRSKMLTLTARPVQSQQLVKSQPRQWKKVETQQVSHKRHFRRQNSLRPLNQKFHSNPLEHTAEAPGPLKFKPLPVIPKETLNKKTSDSNTGAPALNRSRNLKTLDQSSSKTRSIPEPVQEIKSETEKDGVIKIARLPILKAESTSSASIGSLRNFTNVRDLDPGFDKGYDSRKKAKAAALKAAQISQDNFSGLIDGLSLER